MMMPNEISAVKEELLSVHKLNKKIVDFCKATLYRKVSEEYGK